jgi:cell division protein FtsI (penicillin-binding protein 3)/stage V sporulation protein D (sporulation-specific penicillin-binding protein)
MKPQSVRRIRIISAGVFVFALVLIGKLYLVQIVSGEDFADRADRQYIQSSYDYFDRGSIFLTSKDGERISAATLKTGYIIAINPKLIQNPEDVYNRLSSYVPLDEEEFLSKALKKDDPYEEIVHKIPKEIVDEIDAFKIPGVEIHKERWRYYPGNTLAAHTLGLIAYKDNDLAGRYGLERYYEDILDRNNDSVFVNFFAEMFSNVKKSISDEESIEGDIVTSIEPTVEAYLEEELRKINEKWNSQYTGGIIINPMNGEIYAMALDPTFDPNALESAKGPSVFTDHLVESVYEMGSIIKPLTMAAGIDAGAVTEKTTYFDAGFLTLNNKTISNYDGRGRGLVSMQEVLNQSLNTGAAFVVSKMGKENFAKYMIDYGIGEETGIDLPNEIHGLTDNLKSPREIEYATASFGQGIAMTPIETVRALATLGNGGMLVNPHIVTKIDYSIGGGKKIVQNPSKQILKKETSEEITRMLVHVVDTALLNGNAKIDNYSVAAKTGTAQVANPDGGGYYNDVYLHSFFGYFPAYNPRFLVFLYTFNPKGVKYASETLTVSFLDITNFLINYYEIPPDR